MNKRMLFMFVTILFLTLVSYVLWSTSNQEDKNSTISENEYSSEETSAPTNNEKTSSKDYFWGISFPAVSTVEQLNITKRVLEDVDADKVRFSAHWKFIEPQKGEYDWEALDIRVGTLTEAGVSILLTIESDGPEWACSNTRNAKSCIYSDLDAFEDFVSALAKRYKDKVAYIQFGNEMISDDFFVGSAEQYIKSQNIVYRIYKNVAPETTVLLGGIATGTIRRYTLCQDTSITKWGLQEFDLEYDRVRINNEWCGKTWVREDNAELEKVVNKSLYDVIDVHLYDDYPFWKNYIETVKKKTSNKYPIVVTEFGGPNNYIYGDFKIMSNDRLNEQMRKYLETMSSLDIEAAYFFKMVQLGGTAAHSQSGLLKDATAKNPQYDIFKNR